MYYRVEDKYIVYEDQIAYIRERLRNVMQMDRHSKDGSYLIRSIYFDDMQDSALYENESGVDERSKYRIRNYNCGQTLIKLEEKSKKKGYTHKRGVPISKDIVTGIIEHPLAVQAPIAASYLRGEKRVLSKKLYAAMNVKLMHPVVIVEYEREAFVEKSGNARITLDRNIGASTEIGRFFEKDIYAVPTMEKGAHVLEVKYDELLPDYIRNLIDIGSLQKCAFSKYYYARQINEGNGVYL